MGWVVVGGVYSEVGGRGDGVYSEVGGRGDGVYSEVGGRGDGVYSKFTMELGGGEMW